mmetsp:Transcript_6949/g.11137  ORF Transcript_6949/g.11137 Transcript_6949/m.11137 type:complete len:89 (+) Transcript_6949:1-267(+)
MPKNASSIRDAFAREHRLTRGPVSDAERAALIAHRAKPKLEAHPSPDGTILQNVNTQVEADREARIGFIDKRLKRQRDMIRDGFARAR